ncbi:hypothetical protein CVT26_011318 [Gymnopilus dilepis]|uniref:Ribonucleases P/MRP subunit Pop8-like domain-containing protein n=1 Tax=Gymnopilus dilepis TaxID=231916 RepID=A0A409YR17_9AGAR|nr:hypothetical protein CVT26_011318 [Gymnopilus dilepis]
MTSESLSTNNHYLRFSIAPSTTSELSARKVISDALTESFGLTSASTNVDILWLSGDGSQCIVRCHKEDTAKLAGALASRTDSPRLTLQTESPFLPSLLSLGPSL